MEKVLYWRSSLEKISSEQVSVQASSIGVLINSMILKNQQLVVHPKRASDAGIVSSFVSPTQGAAGDCPLCSGKLLRHVSKSRLYWYCTACRQ